VKTKPLPPKGKDISELLPKPVDTEQQILDAVRANRSMGAGIRGGERRRRLLELANASK